MRVTPRRPEWVPSFFRRTKLVRRLPAPRWHDDASVAAALQEQGFYWVVLGQNPPEIAYWERGQWWLCGEDRPWQPEAVTVAIQARAASGGLIADWG